MSLLKIQPLYKYCMLVRDVLQIFPHDSLIQMKNIFYQKFLNQSDSTKLRYMKVWYQQLNEFKLFFYQILHEHVYP